MAPENALPLSRQFFGNLIDSVWGKDCHACCLPASQQAGSGRVEVGAQVQGLENLSVPSIGLGTWLANARRSKGTAFSLLSITRWLNHTVVAPSLVLKPVPLRMGRPAPAAKYGRLISLERVR